MGVQFRLGYGDHKVVEDFIARDAAGTSAITLDTKAARHQLDAADAAIAAGVDVYWETASERLAYPAISHEKNPLWRGSLIDLDELALSLDARQALVERTIAAHPKQATHVTAPHFYVSASPIAKINVDLASLTSLTDPRPTRAILTISNKLAKDLATELAQQYADASIDTVEIRLSPLGGEDISLNKVWDCFNILHEFRAVGIHVTLGQSGSIGQVAVALGFADAYSVGIGQYETVNFRAAVTRQKKKQKPRRDGTSGGGPQPGVYFPALAATLPKRSARRLLENTNIRSSLRCRQDACASSISGPLTDARRHYLHARAYDMQQLLARPEQWRASMEIDRLTSAVQLRDRINRHHLDSDVSKLQTRTINSLIDGINRKLKAS